MIGSTQISGREDEIGEKNQCKKSVCLMYLDNTFLNGHESRLILIIYHSSFQRVSFQLNNIYVWSEIEWNRERPLRNLLGSGIRKKNSFDNDSKGQWIWPSISCYVLQKRKVRDCRLSWASRKTLILLKDTLLNMSRREKIGSFSML